MRIALLSLMVVTSVPLELLDVDIKEGLFAMAKKILLKEAVRELAGLICASFVCVPMQVLSNPRVSKVQETREQA